LSLEFLSMATHPSTDDEGSVAILSVYESAMAEMEMGPNLPERNF